MSILKPNGKAVGHIRFYDSPNVKRRKTSLDNKKRNYAVTNGDRVETQHLRLHLHSSPIGSWRKVKEGKGPAGLEEDVELWPAKGLRMSRRVHDKSLKRRSPE